MTLRHLRIFMAVCREQSTTAAAEKLFISQPAVSLAVKQLEQYYGVTLFDRSGRKLRITPAGERMYEKALGILSSFDDMETALRNWESAGKVRIGSSITVGTELLPGLIRTLKQKYPDLEIYGLVNSSELIERKLLDNELDLAVIEGMVHSDAIASKNLISDELGVYCHESNPLRRERAVGIEDIAAAPLLLREPNSAAREMVDALMRINGLSVSPVWESTSTHALLSAAMSGLGVAILPARLADGFVGRSGLVRLRTRGFSMVREYKLIYLKNKQLTRALMTFMELCENLGAARKRGAAEAPSRSAEPV